MLLCQKSTLALNSDVIDKTVNERITKLQNEMITRRTQTIEQLNSMIASVALELDLLSKLARTKTIETSKNKAFSKFKSYCSVLQAYISFNSLRLKEEFDPSIVASNITKASDQAYDDFMTIMQEKKHDLIPIMDDPKRTNMCVVSNFVRLISSVFSESKSKFETEYNKDGSSLVQQVDIITNSLRKIRNTMSKSVDTCLELVDASNCVASFVSIITKILKYLYKKNG